MSSVRHEPIALQIAQQLSLESLLPGDVLERLERKQEARERGDLDPDDLDCDDFAGDDFAGEEDASDAKEPPLPEDVRRFMWHYQALLRSAHLLIGGPQLDRLSRLHDRIGEDFKPGGPPESPVYESYAVQHILSNVPVGLSRETPYSVLARILQEDPSRAAFLELARELASSHHDLYRVRAVQGTHLELEHLRSGTQLSVRTSSCFLQAEDRLLARLLRFEGAVYLAEAPYLLRTPDEQWLAYLQRIAQQSVDAAEDAARSRLERPANSARLTPKQRARLRQQRKRVEQAQTPEATIVQHLKFGRSDRFWLDFIVTAYAGERGGIACLVGVPDASEALD